MDQFLSTVERKAYRMAMIATGSPDDALDIVQDAMIGLVRKYSSKPSQEWKPLFYRILQSRILDWRRKSRVRSRWMSVLNRFRKEDEEEAEDGINAIADPVNGNPLDKIAGEGALEVLEQALKTLPMRQQQAFLLRSWEGLNVAETARAMGCGEGSVKTHYSRAIHTLKSLLEDHWP